MFRKLVRTFVVAVVIVGVAASLSLAQTSWFSGTVKSVDAANGAITLTAEDETTKTFEVDKELLKNVKPGHEVELQLVDGKVTGLENYSAGN